MLLRPSTRLLRLLQRPSTRLLLLHLLHLLHLLLHLLHLLLHLLHLLHLLLHLLHLLLLLLHLLRPRQRHSGLRLESMHRARAVGCAGVRRLRPGAGRWEEYR